MAGNYPDKFKSLPLYDGRFEAHKLTAENCEVLFASYPSGTSIASHTHETDNHGIITRGELKLNLNGKLIIVGVGEWYHVPANTEHAAEFAVETDEIEFWFSDNNK